MPPYPYWNMIMKLQHKWQFLHPVQFWIRFLTWNLGSFPKSECKIFPSLPGRRQYIHQTKITYKLEKVQIRENENISWFILWNKWCRPFCSFFQWVLFFSVRISSSRLSEKIHKLRLKMLEKNRWDKHSMVLTFWKKEDAWSKKILEASAGKWRGTKIFRANVCKIKCTPTYTHTQFPNYRVKCR